MIRCEHFEMNPENSCKLVMSGNYEWRVCDLIQLTTLIILASKRMEEGKKPVHLV